MLQQGALPVLPFATAEQTTARSSPASCPDPSCRRARRRTRAARAHPREPVRLHVQAQCVSSARKRDSQSAQSKRTSTNSFPLTPLASTLPSAAPAGPDSLVSRGSKLASRACFSVTSSNRAPRSSACCGGEDDERNAGSSFSTTSEKSLSRQRARTSAASGESSASFVSLRSERREGEIGSAAPGREGEKEGGKACCEEDDAGGDGV